MMNSNFKRETYTTSDILELIHTNPCGPIGIQSYCGDQFLILFNEDYYRMMTMMFLKDKFYVYLLFKWYLSRVEKETGKSLKCLRSDRGGELISHEFNTFCNENGIKRQMLAPRNPPQNGIA